MDKYIIAGLVVQIGLLIVATLAAIISFIEYRTHKAKEYNKLLSELNKRYVDNKDVQEVVMYLRENEPGHTKPTAYQVELFLRFFEELGLYLKTNSLKTQDVKVFFDYYFERFESSDRGIILKEIIKNEDKDLEYLILYRKKMGHKSSFKA